MEQLEKCPKCKEDFPSSIWAMHYEICVSGGGFNTGVTQKIKCDLCKKEITQSEYEGHLKFHVEHGDYDTQDQVQNERRQSNQQSQQRQRRNMGFQPHQQRQNQQQHMRGMQQPRRSNVQRQVIINGVPINMNSQQSHGQGGNMGNFDFDQIFQNMGNMGGMQGMNGMRGIQGMQQMNMGNMGQQMSNMDVQMEQMQQQMEQNFNHGMGQRHGGHSHGHRHGGQPRMIFVNRGGGGGMGFQQQIPPELLEQLMGYSGNPRQRGMDNQEINQLPTMQFKKKKKKEEDKNDKKEENNCQENNCVICMSDFEEGDTLRTMLCLHKFHSQCIDQWLQRKAICPICRKKLVEN